jgi:hypothetical protein
MSKEAAFSIINVPEAVKTALVEFFRGLGRGIDELDDETDLIKGTGATSDEGVDFAIDLSDILGVPVPNSFNPFVHPSGHRGMKLRELTDHAGRFVQEAKEAGHAG